MIGRILIFSAGVLLAATASAQCIPGQYCPQSRNPPSMPTPAPYNMPATPQMPMPQQMPQQMPQRMPPPYGMPAASAWPSQPPAVFRNICLTSEGMCNYFSSEYLSSGNDCECFDPYIGQSVYGSIR